MRFIDLGYPASVSQRNRSSAGAKLNYQWIDYSLDNWLDVVLVFLVVISVGESVRRSRRGGE
jgi:hypothetical protein